MPRYFATTARGTETVLAAELRELGIVEVEERRGGVSFGATLEDAYRVCLWSRVASRVLLPLATFEAPDAPVLYEATAAVNWSLHLSPAKTFAVEVAGRDAPAGPPHFIALKVKDAIVDRIRAAEGSRPDVDTAHPDLRIHVHLAGAHVTLSLDLAGESLHRRGIARLGALAPLKENLAAAILRLAGWPALAEQRPLMDPMCGSATLLIEAAWMALDVAPGLGRARLGAEGWRAHDAELWARLRAEAEERGRAAEGRALRLAGADASPGAVATARANLERAGVARYVRLEQRPLAEAEPPWPEPGLVVTNPPYGERLGEAGELGPLYEQLGDVFKRRFPGWTAWVLCGNPALAKRIGLRPAARHELFNGPIECRLLEIPISAAPIVTEHGPGWRKPSPETEAFARKLLKNRRQLGRWVKAQGLEAYRLYDSDMPEFNLAVDWYAGAVRVEEQDRPKRVAPELAERRLREALQVIPETLGVEPSQVVLRVRRRRTPGEQNERRDDRRELREVREGELRFLVNLTDYLDTGLFLDDRYLRRRIRKQAQGKRFLNLFAYTCTASVAAAAGGALATISVDLSKTYLEWGRRNFELNGLDGPAHRLVRADVLEWLVRGGDRRLYDVIFLAPPTWSRSKAMQHDFDVQRDHVRLVERCLPLLAPGGEILFTTNLRGFLFEAERLEGLEAEEVTNEVTPPDFARRPRLRGWVLRRAG